MLIGTLTAYARQSRKSVGRRCLYRASKEAASCMLDVCMNERYEHKCLFVFSLLICVYYSMRQRNSYLGRRFTFHFPFESSTAS